jgi:hypothetical protein
MSINERQADFFERLEADLTVEMAKLMLQHAPESIADALSDYIHEGTDRLTIDTAAHTDAQDFHANLAETLKALGDVAAKRATDAADGQITLEERDGEVALCKRAIRLVAKLNTSIANTPIGVRQKAKVPALKVVGGSTYDDEPNAGAHIGRA